MLSLLLAATLAVHPQPQMVVSTDWVAEHIDARHVLLLDVSTIETYRAGHIPGAVFLNVRALMVHRNGLPNELPDVAKLEDLFREAGVQKGDRIVITSNEPLYASRAWFTLDYLGWADDAALLDGGNQAWASEKRPITDRPANAKWSDFLATANPDVVISKDDLKTALKSPNPPVLLDARPPVPFRTAHVAKANCLPWAANMTGTPLKLRTVEELTQIYSGVLTNPADHKIVVYCRTGVEATMDYFVLRYLGLHPVLYDGSYVDWDKTETVVTSGK